MANVLSDSTTVDEESGRNVFLSEDACLNDEAAERLVRGGTVDRYGMLRF